MQSGGRAKLLWGSIGSKEQSRSATGYKRRDKRGRGLKAGGKGAKAAARQKGRKADRTCNACKGQKCRQSCMRC